MSAKKVEILWTPEGESSPVKLSLELGGSYVSFGINHLEHDAPKNEVVSAATILTEIASLALVAGVESVVMGRRFRQIGNYEITDRVRLELKPGKQDDRRSPR